MTLNHLISQSLFKNYVCHAHVNSKYIFILFVFDFQTIADVIRTCLGPQAMLKMLMDPMGGIVMTNDGNAILREITVQHPAGKSMIEIARTQDEEVGDGTTSVIVLAGELLANAEPFLEQGLHPTIVIKAYKQALDDIVNILNDQLSIMLDCSDEAKLEKVIKSCVGTKFIGRWSDLTCKIALEAVNTISSKLNGCQEIDIKRYIKVRKFLNFYFLLFYNFWINL